MKTLEERDNKLLHRESSYSRTHSVSVIFLFLSIIAVLGLIFSGQRIEDRLINASIISIALWFSVFQYTKARLQHIASIRHYLKS